MMLSELSSLQPGAVACSLVVGTSSPRLSSVSGSLSFVVIFSSIDSSFPDQELLSGQFPLCFQSFFASSPFDVQEVIVSLLVV